MPGAVGRRAARHDGPIGAILRCGLIEIDYREVRLLGIGSDDSNRCGPDANLIPCTEVRSGNTFAVNKGAISAVQVANCRPITVYIDPCMVARYLLIVEDEVVGRRSPDRNATGPQLTLDRLTLRVDPLQS